MDEQIAQLQRRASTVEIDLEMSEYSIPGTLDNQKQQRQLDKFQTNMSIAQQRVDKQIDDVRRELSEQRKLID